MLTRKRTAVTKLDVALTGAHCPCCGGPLNSSFDPKCSYCGNTLNDGSDWILSKIVAESDEEYVRLLSKKSKTQSFNAAKLMELSKSAPVNNVNSEKDQTSKSAPVNASAAPAPAPAPAPAVTVAMAAAAVAASTVVKQAPQTVNSVVGGNEQNITANANKSEKAQPKEENDSSSATDLVAIAAQMLMADGVIDPNEIALIKRIGQMAHIPNDRLKGILVAVKDGVYPKIKFEDKNPKELKMLFEVAIGMAYADGVLAPDEEKMIRSLGQNIGYSDNDVDAYLKKAQLKYCKK